MFFFYLFLLKLGFGFNLQEVSGARTFWFWQLGRSWKGANRRNKKAFIYLFIFLKRLPTSSSQRSLFGCFAAHQSDVFRSNKRHRGGKQRRVELALKVKSLFVLLSFCSCSLLSFTQNTYCIISCLYKTVVCWFFLYTNCQKIYILRR